jgi:hypothetical protein
MGSTLGELAEERRAVSRHFGAEAQPGDVRARPGAAVLESAAEGLRRRVGLRARPHLRKVEADLVAQVRQPGSIRDSLWAPGSASGRPWQSPETSAALTGRRPERETPITTNC